MAKSPTLGTFVKSKFDSVADTKFGSKTGYATALKKNIEQKKKMADFAQKYATKGIDDKMQKEEDLIGEKTASLTKQEKKVDKAKKALDMATFDVAFGMSPKAVDLAYENLQREEAMLEDSNYEINKANQRIEALKPQKDLIQSRIKKMYAKNLRFTNWGLGPLDKIFPSGADAAAEIRKGKKKGEAEVVDLIEKLAEEKAKASGAGSAGGEGTSGTSGGGAGGKTP